MREEETMLVLKSLRLSRLGADSEMATRLVTDNKNFIGSWRRSSVKDGIRSPLHAQSQSPVSPSGRLRLGSTFRGIMPGVSPTSSVRRVSMSEEGDRGARRGNSFLQDISTVRRQSSVPLEANFDVMASLLSAEPADEPEAGARGEAEAEPEPVFDSADHAMAFQTFVDFMKVNGLVPIAEQPTKSQEKEVEGGKKEEKEAGNKTDLGSAEFDVALEIFRETTGKGDRLEWQEFKDCLHGFLRTGLRRLHSRKTEAEDELYKMRVRMSKFAPSSDNPLAAFKVRSGLCSSPGVSARWLTLVPAGSTVHSLQHDLRCVRLLRHFGRLAGTLPSLCPRVPPFCSPLPSGPYLWHACCLLIALGDD
jgi:hypothetical protein